MADQKQEAVIDGPEILLEWSARKVRPVVLVWLALIFLTCLVVAYFIARSKETITALLAAGATALGTTAPSVMNKVVYRATPDTLEKLPPGKKKKQEYVTVFRWDELSHVKPGKHTFKYFKRFEEPNAVKRFWKLHVSDAWSGEFHVEDGNREEVLALLERLGVGTERPIAS